METYRKTLGVVLVTFSIVALTLGTPVLAYNEQTGENGY